MTPPQTAPPAAAVAAATRPPPAHPTAHFSDLFGRSRGQLEALAAAQGKLIYTYKARGAIQALLEALPRSRGRTVLVPAFHCPTVVYPVLRAGYKVRFYGIGEDLAIDTDDLGNVFDSDVAAVIVIHYFGFETDMTRVAALARLNDAFLIEDWSHSFLRAAPLRLAGETGDAAVYSLWKLVPCGTGGAARRIRAGGGRALRRAATPLPEVTRLYKKMLEEAVENLPDSALRRVLTGLERRRVRRKHARDPVASSAAADERGAASVNDPLSEAYPERDVYFEAGLPRWCRRIVANADLDRVVDTRRANYRAFESHLAGTPGLALWRALDADTCPWGVAVLMDGRAGKDQRLRARGVPFFTFGELLHPLLDTGAAHQRARDTARYLSAKMICFSIHQDIDTGAIPAYCRVIDEIARA